MRIRLTVVAAYLAPAREPVLRSAVDTRPSCRHAPRPRPSPRSTPAAAGRVPAPGAPTPPAASRPGPCRLVDLRPEGVEVDGQTPAAGSAHAPARRRQRNRIAAAAPQLEDLQAAKLRVDDPVVGDSSARVVGELVDAVAAHVPRVRSRDLPRDVRRPAAQPGGAGRH